MKARVSEKGQVTIPKKLRERLGIRPGEVLVIADFLVGAHARSQADRLLTRDWGFYRSAFSGLRLVEPTAR